MSFVAATIIDLSARLRLACAALSAITGDDITPADVDLGGVAPEIADQLRADAQADFWRLVCADPSTTTVPEAFDAQDQAHRAGRARDDHHETQGRAVVG